VINRPPEIAELAVDLHEDLIQMPTPPGEAAHVRYPLLRDLCREQTGSTKIGSSHVDPAFGQQILNVPK
jgi:hypothetical protein